MTKYAYSPDTGEMIRTETPSDWMGLTDVAPPSFDAATAGCFFRNGAWEIVVATHDYSAEKAATLKTGRSMRETVLGRLNGIHLDAIVANDTVTASAVAIAKQQLKDITVWPAVVAAVTGEETKTAFLARYYEVAHELQTAAPYAVTAFTGLDL